MRARPLLLSFIVLFAAVLTAGATDQLRIQDPKSWWRNGQGTIEKSVVSVRPVGVYMEYGIYLTFSARGLGYSQYDTMEVQFQFDLPAGSIVHDSWLWIDDAIVRAEIMDKWTAESIYEEIVNRRRDPSILYKRSDTQYELRIFPMTGTESRKVKITCLVPAQWSLHNVFAPLPANLVRTSKNPLSGISVITWPGGEWKNPRFLENTGIAFEPDYDTTNGPHYRGDLPWAAAQYPVNFAMDAPLRDGMYVNRFENAGGGYYQLALLPSAALGLAPIRKSAVLFDYMTTTYGTSSATPSQVFAAVKSALLTTFSASDSFNLIFSGAVMKRASDSWLPADSATIDSVFTALGPDPISSYSNLPGLLANAIDFVQTGGTAGDLMLVACSDQYGGYVVANDLLADLRAMMTEIIPTHVVNFQNMNPSYNWIGGRAYLGNEYFYTNLTRLTGANYSWLPYNERVDPLIASAFQSLGGFISSFDLHTTVENGFCHSRYDLGKPVGPVYLDRAILQTGRYYGNFPMTVEVSGVYGDSVFNLSLAIDDTSSLPTDSLTAESWAGSYVRSLEAQSQTNDVINEIVRASLDERVLSVYSAFLALEPSRGGEVCYDCIDESAQIVGVEDSTTGADSLAILQAWPNPFNSSTTIRVRVPDDGAQASLRIFDVLGREVRSYDLAAERSGGRTEVTWNGTDPTGAAVNSGVYFVVYRSGAGTQTLKLMILK
jgi:hypothetical protein